MDEACRPSASRAENPKITSAAGFHAITSKLKFPLRR